MLREMAPGSTLNEAEEIPCSGAILALLANPTGEQLWREGVDGSGCGGAVDYT
ncbi:hypothetical protein FRC08_004920 [Ceratobasidium sp. 394]|nr:hypothetical protein FRC08_004920 [Ceratobasidium sp. 394]